ncbi:MAG: GWxTD domain-containing protein [Sphingobacteriales bacterium]|nr:GWxTD domain-containing protein [Sphingobacteriales bacterium]
MKQLLIFICLSTCTVPRLWALQAEINWSLFYLPNKGMYVEHYILIPSSTVRFAPDSKRKKQAKVEITTTFAQGNTIVKADRYVLNSLPVADTLPLAFNLIDQKRTLLPDGDYVWEMHFRDLTDTSNQTTFRRDLHIAQVPTDRPAISDILLVEQYQTNQTENEYSRNGYDLVPNVLHYFPTGLDRLALYAEIYNTDKVANETDYLVKYYIAQQGSVEPSAALQGYKKMKATNVYVVFADFDISRLYSGNYEAVVELRNRNNELLSMRRTLFQRSQKNPEADKPDAIAENAAPSSINFLNTDIQNTFVAAFTLDEAQYHLQSVLPLLATPAEERVIANLLRVKDLNYMQRYLYRFWEQLNPTNPKNAFDKYQTDLKWVDNEYGTPQSEGFATELGRVYLRYGKPNDIIAINNDPVAFPYQIWHYYQLDALQKDVRFVFYQPNESGDYRLIHSDARNEPYEPNWKRWVFNRARQANNNDAENNQRTEELDYFGNRGRESDPYFRKNNKSEIDRPTKIDD